MHDAFALDRYRNIDSSHSDFHLLEAVARLGIAGVHSLTVRLFPTGLLMFTVHRGVSYHTRRKWLKASPLEPAVMLPAVLMPTSFQSRSGPESACMHEDDNSGDGMVGRVEGEVISFRIRDSERECWRSSGHLRTMLRGLDEPGQ